MKKYILSFLFISTAIFAQDYSKLKNAQLVDSIRKKKEIIINLNKTIAELQKKQVDIKSKKDDVINVEDDMNEENINAAVNQSTEESLTQNDPVLQKQVRLVCSKQVTSGNQVRLRYVQPIENVCVRNHQSSRQANRS